MAFDFDGFEALLAQQKQLDEKKQECRAQALEQIKQIINQFGFTAKELGLSAGVVAITNKARVKVAAKYCTPNGVEWSGRGRMPKAFEPFIAAGHTLESMLIAKDQPAA